MGVQFRAAADHADAPVVDVNGYHASRILRLLDLPVEACGDVPAPELRERATLAIAWCEVGEAFADGEAGASLERAVRGADPSHLRLRLVELLGVAEWACGRGHPVTWG